MSDARGADGGQVGGGADPTDAGAAGHGGMAGTGQAQGAGGREEGDDHPAALASLWFVYAWCGCARCSATRAASPPGLALARLARIGPFVAVAGGRRLDGCARADVAAFMAARADVATFICVFDVALHSSAFLGLGLRFGSGFWRFPVCGPRLSRR